jgi:hypothetical protein
MEVGKEGRYAHAPWQAITSPVSRKDILARFIELLVHFDMVLGVLYQLHDKGAVP